MRCILFKHGAARRGRLCYHLYYLPTSWRLSGSAGAAIKCKQEGRRRCTTNWPLQCHKTTRAEDGCYAECLAVINCLKQNTKAIVCFVVACSPFFSIERSIVIGFYFLLAGFPNHFSIGTSRKLVWNHWTTTSLVCS